MYGIVNPQGENTVTTIKDITRDLVGEITVNHDTPGKGYPMEYFKEYTDFIGRHVIVPKMNSVIGYVWGGEPGQFMDTPDKVYVTINSQDYAIFTTQVELMNIPHTLEGGTAPIQNNEDEERYAG